MAEVAALSRSGAELDLKNLAAEVVARAVKAGATDAEAVVSEGDEFSVSVRMGEVETLQESGSRGLGLRVFVGQRSASASTSDLTPDGIALLVSGAMALAQVTEEDPFAGLADAADFGQLTSDLHLYFEDVYSLPAPNASTRPGALKPQLLLADARITNSQGGHFDAATGRRVLANSRGFLGEYRTSYCGISAAPLAWDGRRDAARFLVFERPAHGRPRIAGVDRRRKLPAAPCGGWERAAYPPSRCRLSLRRKSRAR
jgi:PmbA protein